MSPRRYRKVAIVWAEPATTAGVVLTPEGRMAYAAGDYLVSDSPPTHMWPVRRAVFEATHEPLDPAQVALDRELTEFADVLRRGALPAPGAPEAGRG